MIVIIKKLSAVSIVLFTCLLFMGTVQLEAPVLPTKNFYVNDYSNIIFREHRDKISELATEMYESTGAQLVVLTVKDYAGLSADEYAKAVLTGWEVGAPSGDGAVILINSTANESHFAATGKLAPVFSSEAITKLREENIESYSKSSNYSVTILNTYKDVASAIYTSYGIAPTEEIAQKLEKKSSGIPGFFFMFIAVFAVVGLRSMRINRKYKKKYLFNYDPTELRRSYSRVTKREEDYDPHRAIIYQEDVDQIEHQGGFIIRRKDSGEQKRM